MAKEPREVHLFPPPRLRSHGELYPVIEPPLRDQGPPDWREEVDEFDHFASAPLDTEPSEAVILAAERTALADKKVMALLANKRYVAIGFSLRDDDRDEQAGASFQYVFYDYTDNVAIEVWLDPERNKVTNVTTARYQPAPVEAEIEHVVKLARADRRLSKLVTDDLEGGAILVSPVDPHDPLLHHRIFDVRFGCPDQRLPRFMARVDLSTETVLQVGRVKRCAEERDDG